ncbi:MAG TPA: hypothetical protein VGE13_04525 [Candidatus Saccharimonadales bacterium]
MVNNSPSPISDFVRPSKRSNRTASTSASQLPREAVEEAVVRPPVKKRRKRIAKHFYIIGVGILIALVLGAVVYRVISVHPILDSAVVAKANFPVYAPSTLPEGYMVKKDATNIDNGVLIYTLVDKATGTEITTTVQPWPTGFSMSKMVEGGSINGTSVKVGTLYNLSTESSTKYLLDMGSTLIFLTSPEKVNASIIRNLVDTLEKVN